MHYFVKTTKCNFLVPCNSGTFFYQSSSRGAWKKAGIKNEPYDLARVLHEYAVGVEDVELLTDHQVNELVWMEML